MTYLALHRVAREDPEVELYTLPEVVYQYRAQFKQMVLRVRQVVVAIDLVEVVVAPVDQSLLAGPRSR